MAACRVLLSALMGEMCALMGEMCALMGEMGALMGEMCALMGEMQTPFLVWSTWWIDVSQSEMFWAVFKSVLYFKINRNFFSNFYNFASDHIFMNSANARMTGFASLTR